MNLVETVNLYRWFILFAASLIA